MSRNANFGFGEIHLEAEAATRSVELRPDGPFRVLLVGDFSGRSWRRGAQGALTPRLVDRDHFDDVLAAMNVSLDLPGVPLRFRELEDFHPDRIYQAAPLFRKFEAASAAPPAPLAAAGPGLLDRILAERHEPAGPASAEEASDLGAFIRRVTEGHLAPSGDPAAEQRTAKRQEAAAGLLRAILHDPCFQALEAAWRAVHLLVRELDTDGDLKLYLLDATLPEFVEQLDEVREELEDTGRWAVIAGNYGFGQSALDASVLGRIAEMAGALGAPFLAEAQPPGGEVTEAAWQEFRRSAKARSIGLALPRFLLRLPYGEGGEAIESFPFEEMPESQHTAYLWGNPAFFCAWLIGQSFLSCGWDLQPLQHRIDGLPLHVYRKDGEPVAKPCAEVLMSEREAEELLDAGFMPLASVQGEDAALLVRFQSVAEPSAPLAGLGG